MSNKGNTLFGVSNRLQMNIFISWEEENHEKANMLCYKVILQICLLVSRRTFFGWNDLFLDPLPVFFKTQIFVFGGGKRWGNSYN